MKTLISIIVGLAILVALGAWAFYKNQKPSEPAAPVVTETPYMQPSPEPTFRFGPDLALGDRTFKILQENINARGGPNPAYQDLIELVAVYEKDSAQPAQILKGYMYYSAYLMSELKIESQDANFDGHPDVKFLRDITAKNSSWNYWLYDPATDTFVYNKSLSEIYDPVFDYENKKVTSHMSCGAACSTDYTYAFSGNEAVQTRIDSRDVVYSSKRADGTPCEPLSCPVFVRTIKELRNGQMVTISEEMRSEPF